MRVQHNIDIRRRDFGRNMHEPKLQPLTHKIDNQRPILVPITISAHDRERRTDCLQLAHDRRLANITQMPDLVRAAGKTDNLLRQLVMRIGQDKNPKHRYLRKAGIQETKALTSSCFPGR